MSLRECSCNLERECSLATSKIRGVPVHVNAGVLVHSRLTCATTSGTAGRPRRVVKLRLVAHRELFRVISLCM